MSNGRITIAQLIKEVDSDLRLEYGSSCDFVSQLLLSASDRTVQASTAIPITSDVSESESTIFDTLIALSDEHINSIEFNKVSPKWLSLYVDANLLSALHDLCLAFQRGNGDLSCCNRLVRRLDMAIIIGGATKPNRMQWIQRAIKLAQVNPDADKSAISIVDHPHMLRKRRRLNHVSELLFASKPISDLTEPPSIERYLAAHYDAPFVLRSYLNNGSESAWPAFKKWKDPEYLLSQVGRGRCVPVEEGSSYDDSNWGQSIVPFEDFLVRAGFWGSEVETGSRTDRPMYLAQHSLFRQFPELERDMNIPAYVRSRPPATTGCPSYHPPDTNDGVIVNVWVGSGSGEIVSPAHTDPYYNCYTQVLGQKRVWVAPPSCGPYMACHGEKSLESGAGTVASQYMNNTSTIPILRPNTTSGKLASEFPTFKQHVWPQSMGTVLEPGDLLVMPPGWWHAMRGEGEGPGWSVSMWY